MVSCQQGLISQALPGVISHETYIYQAMFIVMTRRLASKPPSPTPRHMSFQAGPEAGSGI